jgi:hypothetical protein
MERQAFGFANYVRYLRPLTALAVMERHVLDHSYLPHSHSPFRSFSTLKSWRAPATTCRSSWRQLN